MYFVMLYFSKHSTQLEVDAFMREENLRVMHDIIKKPTGKKGKCNGLTSWYLS